jgi:predicted esterase
LKLFHRQLLFGVLLMFSASAWAQTPPSQKSPQSGDVVNGVIFYKQFVNYGPGKDSWINFALKMPPDWKQGDAIRGVMCICTWKNTPDGVMGNLRSGSPLIQWAAKNKFVLISWSQLGFFTTSLSNDEMGQKQDEDWSRRFDIAARKWEYSIQQLTLKYKLPTKDFLIDGISNGAQTAHRLVLRKPEYFAAIHIHVNSSYDIPTPAGKSLEWLVTTGEREYGYAASQRFYYNALELGYPVIYKAGENLGHAGSPEIDRLTVAFFDYLLPYLPDYRDKAPQFKGDPSRLMRHPGYVGDWLNQQAFPFEKAHLVEGRYQTALPTREVAVAWGPLFEK